MRRSVSITSAPISETVLGAFLLTAGLFIFSFQDVMVKLLSDRFPVHQIVFVRGLIALPMIFMIVHFESGLGTLATKRPSLHALRAFIGFGAFFFYYLALSTLPLTTVVAIWFTSPLFITALAVPMLGERVGWRRWSGILVGFAGALVIVQPSGETFQMATLLPLLAAVCYAIASLLGRKLGITESGSVLAFYMMVTFFYMGAGMAAGLAHFSFAVPDEGPLRFLLQPWSMPVGVELALLVLIGIISGVGFWMLASAYKIARAPAIAPFEYTSMLWASVLSFFIWGEVPGASTVLGTLMIVASGIWVLKREADIRKKPVAGKGAWRTRRV